MGCGVDVGVGVDGAPSRAKRALPLADAPPAFTVSLKFDVPPSAGAVNVTRTTYCERSMMPMAS